MTTKPRSTAAARPSARERLLLAANELFYREGVQTVGIDRVIEQAGVAKASLYNTFGSKEALIHAYLESRHAHVAEKIAKHVSRHERPRERLLAVFEAQSTMFSAPGYRGCAFVSASAEAHTGDQIEQAAADFRSWMRQLFTDLAEQAGVADDDAGTLARQLQMLYDGGGISARMDRDPSAAQYSRAAAEALLDAALTRR